ncbi:hypothetical protein INH39_25545 [Massilia violaceinigra]|uniref:Portal protein n=1 Tax=Massilia violaceinigra TaxID=2045208 RepID=A0ABY4A1Z6_9BURK|nr:hypothetical protein [Massilia violaceinigra]UOD28776.1 hypothetical protein INH39_25545 [Massilia violaceinigra]
MAKMTDDELRALTDAEMQDATGFCGSGGRLEAQRRKNLRYFMAEATEDLAPPDVPGRSTVVDTTVRNTLLGMEAPLIKTFCGTENVVEFSETTQDDEEKAKQVTDYLNYLLRKKNPGYSIVTTWIRDALLQKVGFVKVWWDASIIESKEEYRGQTDVQLAILLDDDEVEPVEQKAYPDPEAEKAKAKQLEQMQAQFAQMQQPMGGREQAPQNLQQAAQQIAQFAAQPVPQLYDITVRRKKDGGRLCIENVPPEEILVRRDAKSLRDTPFVGHRLRRTIGQLTAAGYRNVDKISADGDGDDMSQEAAQRRYADGDSPDMARNNSIDPTAREVWITECYVMCDYDGNGIPSWRKVVRAGDQILENEECDDHPFVGWCPIPMPHRLFGLCPADLAVEPQRVKTALKRAAFDNISLSVNGRYYALDGQVNLDDLLSSRPGGVVRVKSLNAVGRLDQGVGDVNGAMQLMESVELDAEESTGWTRQSQGGNGMPLDQTATQVNIVTNRADSRVEIIARQFAETGYTDLFKRMLKLVSQYQNKAEMVKLGGKWQNVDPREWTNQFDMTINVGLGTGNKDQQVQHLMALKQAQAEGLQIGICKPQHVYNADIKLAEALGFKSGDQFFHDPSAPPDPNAPPEPPPPPNPDVVKAQAQQQQHAAEMQFKQQQAEADRKYAADLERYKGDMQMRVDQNRQEAEARQKQLEIEQQAQLEALKEQYRNEEAREKYQADMARLELERYKIDKDAETEIVIAQIAAKQANDAALMAAEQRANMGAANGDA